MSSRPTFAAVLVFALMACSEQEFTIPADRSILAWYGPGAEDRNRSLLPRGFNGPDVHSCAADPTRAYLAELFVAGQGDAQVQWHWAPIVSGPRAAKPTLDQPEFSVAGNVEDASDSLDDMLADHPFGFDVVADVTPDAAFASLPFNGPLLTPRAIHPEVEMRLFPRAALANADAEWSWTLMRGVWVLDCGHPPYGAEIHPPTLLGYARPSDDRTTIAAALVVPYRSSLLFNQDAAIAADFGNQARFDDPASKPFSLALGDALLRAAIDPNYTHLSTHALMIANRFDTLDWLVCAPLPRPVGATLDARWRFTARTGVAVTARSLETSGCVRVTATMSAAYVPMPLAYADAEWSWTDLSTSASNQLGQSIDIRLALIQKLKENGVPNPESLPALQPGNHPRIDAYPALSPQAGADADSPTGIVSDANDQPFPFYGRVRAAWK